MEEDIFEGLDLADLGEGDSEGDEDAILRDAEALLREIEDDEAEYGVDDKDIHFNNNKLEQTSMAMNKKNDHAEMASKKSDQVEYADSSSIPPNDVIVNGRSKLLTSCIPEEENSLSPSTSSWKANGHLAQQVPSTVEKFEVDNSNETFESQVVTEIKPLAVEVDSSKHGDDVSPSQPVINYIPEPEISEELRQPEESVQQTTGSYEFGNEISEFQEFDNKLGNSVGRQMTEDTLGEVVEAGMNKPGLVDPANASTSGFDFGNASWELPFPTVNTSVEPPPEPILPETQTRDPVVQLEKESVGAPDEVKLKPQEEPSAAAGLFFGDKTPAFAISAPTSSAAQVSTPLVTSGNCLTERLDPAFIQQVDLCPVRDSVDDETTTLGRNMGQNGPKSFSPKNAPLKRSSSFEFGDTPNLFKFGSSGVSVVQSSKTAAAGSETMPTTAFIGRELASDSQTVEKDSPKKTSTFNFGSGSAGNCATDFFKYYSEDKQTHPVVKIPSSQFEARSAESAEAFFTNIPTPPYNGSPVTAVPMAFKTPMSHSRSASRTPVGHFSFGGGNAHASPTVKQNTVQSGPNIARQRSRMFDFASPEAQAHQSEEFKFPVQPQGKSSSEAMRSGQPREERGRMSVPGPAPGVTAQPFVMPNSIERTPIGAVQPMRTEQPQRRQPHRQVHNAPASSPSSQSFRHLPDRQPPPDRSFQQSSTQKPVTSYSQQSTQKSGQSYQPTSMKKPVQPYQKPSTLKPSLSFHEPPKQQTAQSFPKPFMQKSRPAYQKPRPVQSFQQPNAFDPSPRQNQGQVSQSGYAKQGQYSGSSTQGYTQPTAFQQSSNPSSSLPPKASRFQGSTSSFRQPGTTQPFQRQHTGNLQQEPNQQTHDGRQEPPHIRMPAQQTQFYNPALAQTIYSPEVGDGGNLHQTTHPVQAEVPSPHYANKRMQNFGSRRKIDQGTPMMDVPLNGQHSNSSQFRQQVEQYRPPPPHPTISFSLGGSLAVVYPEGSSAADQLYVLTGNDESRAMPSGKLVRIYNTKSIALDAIVAAEIDQFPGPIASASSKDIERFFQMLPQYTAGMEETRKMLWNVLGVFANSTGADLRGKVVKILLEGGAQNEHESYQDPPQEVSVPKEILDRTNDYLSQGLSHKGCSLLMSHSAITPSLLLAMGLAHNNPDLRTQALEAITVPLGPSTPLFALCWVHAGAAQHLIKKDEYMVALVSNWKQNLAALFQSSGQGGTTGPMAVIVMRELGDRLWLRHKQVFAAQLCYLCAGEALETQPRKDPRLLLLGGDHINNSASAFLSYGTTHDAIHMTEIYEYVKSKKDKNFVLPFFQKCKLAHAKKLASLGLPGRALKYCKCIQGIGNKRPNDGSARAIEAEVGELIKHLSMAHFGTAQGLSHSVIGTVASAVTSGVTSGLSTGLSWLVGGTSKASGVTESPNTELQQHASSLPPRSQYRSGGIAPRGRPTNGSQSLRASSNSPMPPLPRPENARTISAPHSRPQQRTLGRGNTRQVTRSTQREKSKSITPGGISRRVPQRTGSSPSLVTQSRDPLPSAYSSTSRIQTLGKDTLPSSVQPNLPPGNPQPLKDTPGPGTRQDSTFIRRPLSRVNSASRHRPRAGRRTPRPRS